MQWLADLVAPLNHVLFHLGADAVSWAELLGFLTGAIAVWLTVRSHLANFPVGIANSALFLVLFVSARLWADSGLQVVYIVLGFVGWWQWLHGGVSRSALIVGRATPMTLVICGFVVVFGTWGLTIGLGAAHDVAPFWDALTTCLSLAAQWLLNTKKVENWGFWLAADIIYIPLYTSKRLDLTAVVYVLFFMMSLAGSRSWIRAYRAQGSTTPADPADPAFPVPAGQSARPAR